MIVPSPNMEITKIPMGLNFIPSIKDIKEIIFGKKATKIKNTPIKIQKNEYIGSKVFFLTKNVIRKIIIKPIKNAINLECIESISYFL